MGRIELLNQFKSIPGDDPVIQWSTIQKFSAQFEIGDILNDGYATTGGNSFSPEQTSIYIGHGWIYPYHAFFRFIDVTINQNAPIYSAKISFASSGDRSGSPTNVDVFLEDADDASRPSSGPDLINRPLGNALEWNNIEAWTNNDRFLTPNLSSIFQPIFNRSGWNTGHALTVHLINTGTTDGAYRYAIQYNESVLSLRPILNIIYGKVNG